MIRKLDLQKTLTLFETEIFKTESDDSHNYKELADVGEFHLFKLDECNNICLQFDKQESTYSIVNDMFEDISVNDGEDLIDTLYLETYSMDDYNRDFLTSRIVEHISRKIIGSK